MNNKRSESVISHLDDIIKFSCLDSDTSRFDYIQVKARACKAEFEQLVKELNDMDNTPKYDIVDFNQEKGGGKTRISSGEIISTTKDIHVFSHEKGWTKVAVWPAMDIYLNKGIRYNLNNIPLPESIEMGEPFVSDGLIPYGFICGVDYVEFLYYDGSAAIVGDGNFVKGEKYRLVKNHPYYTDIAVGASDSKAVGIPYDCAKASKVSCTIKDISARAHMATDKAIADAYRAGFDEAVTKREEPQEVTNKYDEEFVKKYEALQNRFGNLIDKIIEAIIKYDDFDTLTEVLGAFQDLKRFHPYK